MQGLKRFQDFAVSDEVGSRTQAMWAIVTLVVVVVVVVVIGFFYLRPVGRTEYRVQMSESGGITSSTEVRVAGIPVGDVTEVKLADQHVDVRLSVESSVFLGDQTSAQVRMLTVVGGAYVALLPAGDEPLGDTVIPKERTTVPYSMSEVLDDASRTVQQIDAKKMRKAAVAATDTLDSAPGALRRIVPDVEKLMALLDDQQRQVESLASLGGEYTTELAGEQEALEQMIGRIRAVLPVMVGYKDRGIVTYDALSELVLYVGDVLGEPYQKRFKQPLHRLVESASATKATADRMNEVITMLKGMVDKLSAAAHPKGVALDFGDRVLDGAVCIPIAGRKC
ncbi:MlaD family protein [Gordonia zhaorongruii]|uniref:MlaD family protein n=1 Tax=Gordonia zhaorongruii TaxID=2597659 RepID=UPI0010441A72|nr:MlaD family protein [Gordonia zhaorongruii]